MKRLTVLAILLLATLSASLYFDYTRARANERLQFQIISLLQDIKQLHSLSDGLASRRQDIISVRRQDIGDAASVWILDGTDEWKLERNEGICIWTDPTGRFMRLMVNDPCPPER